MGRNNKMKEKEGHYYMCSCGKFYKIINGKQVRQEMKDFNSNNIKDGNFHEGKCKGKHLGGQTSAREHGVNVKRKIIDKNMGEYSDKK
jgi:hypothetical protein